MRRPQHYLIAVSLLAGCEATVDGWTKEDPGGNDDVHQALAALPNAEVLEWTPDGLPTYVVGEMMKVGSMQSDDPIASDNALRPLIAPVLAPFRLHTGDLVLRKMNVDEQGDRHFRYAQSFNGLPVIGGDLVVHVDVKGAVYAVNGTARGDIPADMTVSLSESAAKAAIAGDGRFAGLTAGNSRIVYLQAEDGSLHKTYELTVEGMRGQDPARDRVYVDTQSGAIVADYPQIYFAENRKVYSLGGGTSLPGTLKRSEGQAATSDIDVNAAYDGTGDAYEAYKNFWNRDSYNNAGAALISSVHYSSNYCNAYWNGTQMVYGDGSSSQGCAPLARSVDVTAHELTHAVTENESGLVYSGESGGINESLSDIFGTFTEAWTDGGKNGTLAISSDTWLLGEDVISGGLRYMCDPAKDGASKDYWTSSAGSVDVHYSSGIGNLNFCLLTKGGTHPRGKSTINVPGIGMDKAIRIYYKAQTDILTSSSKYANLRTAMEQAATALGYDQATKDAVSCSWAAVGVGTAPTTCGGGGGGGGGGTTDGTLTNGVAVTNISDAAGGQKFWKLDVPANQATLTFTIAGGSGDADLYVQAGSKPSKTVYQCRPYKNGNAETCTFTPPAAGTYWVMLDAYAAYSGVSLTGTYSASGGGGGGGDPYLTNGTAVTGITGASASAQYWRVAAPAGKTLTIKISGGTGDADMYTRFGARPTTSTYSCRPYLNGNAETCTQTNTQAGDYYVMVRGYTAFSGLSLIASY
jgi:vibriolysin